MASGSVLSAWQPSDNVGPREFGAVLTTVPGTTIPALRFNPDETWEAHFTDLLNSLYGDTTGYDVVLVFNTPTNTTGAVRLDAALKYIENNVDAPWEGSFGTPTAATVTVADSDMGEIIQTTLAIPKANDDGLIVGGKFVLRIRRLGDHSADTHIGPLYLTNVVLRET